MAIDGKPALRLGHHDGVRIATLATLWWLIAAGQFAKFLGPAATLALLPAIVAASLMTVALVRRLRASRAAQAGRLAPFLAQHGAALGATAAAAAFFVLYLIARRHLLGEGGDRGAALDHGAAALLAGINPYPALLALMGHPFLELPGAFLLAIPFHALGAAALQNPFWLAVFATRLFAWLPDARDAALRFALLLINPGLMRDYGMGSDYVIDAVILVLAIDAAHEAYRPGRGVMAKAAAILFCALALSIHPVFWVALPVMILAVEAEAGARADHVFAAGVVAAMAALCLPFYFADPGRFGPVALFAEATSMPAGFWFLPVIAAASPFFILPEAPQRATLMAAGGIGLAVVIGPPVVARIARSGFSDIGTLCLPILLLLMAGWQPTSHAAAPRLDHRRRAPRPTGRHAHR